MARKKKKGMKAGKPVQVEKKRNIVLFKSASEPVQVPDVLYLFKKRFKGTRGLFVDSNSVQGVVSLPLASGGLVNRKSEVLLYKRKRGKAGVAEFVPASCITNSTTPVVHFNKPKLPAAKTSKKKKFCHDSEFVPVSCITNQISLPYLNDNNEKTNKFLDQQVQACYQIILGKTKYRKKRKNSAVFVPPCCITDSPTLVYHFPAEVKPVSFHNPYPDSLHLSPNIVSTIKAVRPKPKSQQVFIPVSCITGEVSQPYQKAMAKPITMPKFTYVDRPNTPDIVVSTVKINKKKTNKVVPFVPKSCTVEQTRRVLISQSPQSTEALAKTEPLTAVEKKSSGNLLPIVALLAILAMVVGYVLQK